MAEMQHLAIFTTATATLLIGGSCFEPFGDASKEDKRTRVTSSPAVRQPGSLSRSARRCCTPVTGLEYKYCTEILLYLVQLGPVRPLTTNFGSGLSRSEEV